jgi:hypothetical protein
MRAAAQHSNTVLMGALFNGETNIAKTAAAAALQAGATE